MDNDRPRVTTVTAPGWAVWMLGFFALIVLAGGGAWLSSMYSRLSDAEKEISTLKVSQAITSERLTGIATSLGEIKGQLMVILARMESPPRAGDKSAMSGAPGLR